MTATPITLYHCPQTRSSSCLTLLEALKAPYRLHLVNIKTGEQNTPAYQAINPMGKVPTLGHGQAIITESIAIFIYLADLFPDAGLAPALNDPARGPYLRWMAYYAATFEPTLIDRYKHPTDDPAPGPFGDYATQLALVNDHLTKGPFLLGDRYSAADILWASALRWITLFKLVPETPAITAYIGRVTAQPGFAEAAAIDQKILAEQGAA